MDRSTTTDVAQRLAAQPLSARAFAPYGDVIEPAEDGALFGPADATLELQLGTPRLYIMRLHDRVPSFHRITRHRAVTQCLASVGGASWLLAVCPPDGVELADAMPDVGRLAAFVIPGNVAVKLHRGTWHAGPYFDGSEHSFFNLELADTNEVDHHSEEIGDWRIVRDPTVDDG